MNITFLLIGVGLGFFVAACLGFYIIWTCAKGSSADREHRLKVDERLLGQQKQIMFATARIADALDKNAELFQKWMNPK